MSNVTLSNDPTWGVVVVHGVGHAKPGATVDAFVGALKELHKGGLATVDQSFVDLPEAHSGATFPVHVRQLAVSALRSGSPGQAVFAEVYWADLSKASQNLWHLVLRLVTMLFHMRYLSDQAAAYCSTPFRGLTQGRRTKM